MRHLGALHVLIVVAGKALPSNARHYVHLRRGVANLTLEHQPVELPNDPLSTGVDMCWGYWSPTCKCLGTCVSDDPKIHDCPQNFQEVKGQPWEGRAAFLERLYSIEAIAREWVGGFQWQHSVGGTDATVEKTLRECNIPGELWQPFFLFTRRFWGPASSRIEEDTPACRYEFDALGHECWTGGYGPYYIEKHGVLPARQFYEYIMTVDVSRYRRAMDEVKACAQRENHKLETAFDVC